MTEISDTSRFPKITASLTQAHNGLHVFVDGCHEPSTRHGGWAFVVYRDDTEITSGFGGVERSANNTMELTAVREAIVWINSTAAGEPALIWSDSVYAVEGCNHWRPIWKNNGWKKSNPGGRGRNRAISDADLWKAIDRKLADNPDITIAWCKGHSGIVGNERADDLSDQGRRSIGRPRKV
jgi:ribonuclease HI